MALEILLPAAVFLGLGVLSTVILLVASKYMGVEQDKTVEELLETLPGVNCGACGYAGCEDYATALKGGDVMTNLCIPGGDGCSKKISEILGVAYQDVVEQVAFVHCNGNCESTSDIMEYDGIRTCNACNMFYSGKGSCNYACLGYGDCMVVCKYDAISIVDGVAVVDRTKCAGCGLCAKQCPNSLIAMQNSLATVFVVCSNRLKGGAVRKVCKTGCIACGLCTKKCEYGAITVENNTATIDQSKCTACGECIAACPTKAIQKLPVARVIG